MKKLVVLVAATAVFFTLKTPAPAADSDLCMKANAELESFLQQAPKTCAADADCDGFYYRTGSCGLAIVLRKDHATPDFTETLKQKQQLTLDACSPELSHRAACTPKPFHAACV